MRRNPTYVLILAMFFGMMTLSPARAGLLTGIGLMGESLMDEYQFYTEDPADRSDARSMVEVLAALRDLNFGEFTTDPPPSPRLQGYEYNWARSRSTAAASFDVGAADFRPLTELGQHTGLAGQVAEGKVTLSGLFIGSNDFLQFFLSPVADPEATLNALVPEMVNNTAEAVTTVLGASEDVKMVVFTLPDVTVLPAAQASIAQAVGSGQVTQEQADALLMGIGAATDAFNDGLMQLADTINENAGEQRIALADFHGLVEGIYETSDPLILDGVEIDKFTPGFGVEHLILPDGIHPNTAFSGLLANLFLDTINTQFGADVELLSEEEIIDFATTSIPEPTSLSLLGAAVTGLALVRRRRAARSQ